MKLYNCPVCNKPALDTYIPHSRRDILVADYVPHVGSKETLPFDPDHQKALLSILVKNGVDPIRVVFVSFWGHVPGERRSTLGKTIFEECYKHYLNQFLFMATTATGILLYGSEITKEVADVKVSAWTGLKVSSKYFNVPVMYACEKIGKTMGETELAVSRFARDLKRL